MFQKSLTILVNKGYKWNGSLCCSFGASLARSSSTLQILDSLPFAPLVTYLASDCTWEAVEGTIQERLIVPRASRSKAIAFVPLEKNETHVQFIVPLQTWLNWHVGGSDCKRCVMTVQKSASWGQK